MTIYYRKAVEADKLAVEKLNEESTQGKLRKYSKSKRNLFDISEYIISGGNFWVAEDSDKHKLVGSVAVRLIGKSTAKVKALRVHPNYRRQGIAKKLMQMLENYCKDKNHLKLILGVGSESIPAVKLYESLDYVKYEDKMTDSGLVYYYRKNLSA